MKKIAVWYSFANDLGGVTTFVKNFVRRMSKYYDITIYCYTIDTVVLQEVLKYANVQVYDKPIEEDVCILASAWGGKQPVITSKKVIQTIHADYHKAALLGFKYIKHPKTTHHTAVSLQVKKAFEEITPYKIDAVIYNLL